jgi:hypothetical protein
VLDTHLNRQGRRRRGFSRRSMDIEQLVQGHEPPPRLLSIGDRIALGLDRREQQPKLSLGQRDRCLKGRSDGHLLPGLDEDLLPARRTTILCVGPGLGPRIVRGLFRSVLCRGLLLDHAADSDLERLHLEPTAPLDPVIRENVLWSVVPKLLHESAEGEGSQNVHLVPRGHEAKSHRLCIRIVDRAPRHADADRTSVGRDLTAKGGDPRHHEQRYADQTRSPEFPSKQAGHLRSLKNMLSRSAPTVGGICDPVPAARSRHAARRLSLPRLWVGNCIALPAQTAISGVVESSQTPRSLVERRVSPAASTCQAI